MKNLYLCGVAGILALGAFGLVSDSPAKTVSQVNIVAVHAALATDYCPDEPELLIPVGYSGRDSLNDADREEYLALEDALSVTFIASEGTDTALQDINDGFCAAVKTRKGN